MSGFSGMPNCFGTEGLVKAILRDVMGEEKFYFSLFSSYIYVMTLVVIVL